MTSTPWTTRTAYNTITINGLEWIGTAWPQGAAHKPKWENVSGQGTAGATSKFGGLDLCDFKVEFYCWEPEHIEFFDGRVRPMLMIQPETKKPTVHTVDYPELAKLRITQCIVKEIGQLVESTRDGLYAYPVTFGQYRAPKPVQTLKAPGGEGGHNGRGEPNFISRVWADPKGYYAAQLNRQIEEEIAIWRNE